MIEVEAVFQSALPLFNGPAIAVSRDNVQECDGRRRCSRWYSRSSGAERSRKNHRPSAPWWVTTSNAATQ